MSIGMWILVGFRLVVFVLYVAASVYGIHAIYYAYIKTKDEREKYIVLRSTAHAFAVILLYFFLAMIVAVVGARPLSSLWELLHFGMENTTFAVLTALLGVCLFINKHRAGGA